MDTDVQGIMLKSTDFLRRVIAPVGGQGGVTLSYLCPRCDSFPLKDYISGLNWKEAVQLVARTWWRKKMNGERPTGYWWYKQESVPVRQRFSKRMRYRKVCVKT